MNREKVHSARSSASRHPSLGSSDALGLEREVDPKVLTVIETAAAGSTDDNLAESAKALLSALEKSAPSFLIELNRDDRNVMI